MLWVALQDLFSPKKKGCTKKTKSPSSPTPKNLSKSHGLVNSWPRIPWIHGRQNRAPQSYVDLDVVPRYDLRHPRETSTNDAMNHTHHSMTTLDWQKKTRNLPFLEKSSTISCIYIYYIFIYSYIHIFIYSYIYTHVFSIYIYNI